MNVKRLVLGGLPSLVCLTWAAASCELAAGVQDTVLASCEPGEKRACYTGPEATKDVGVCKAGVETCAEDGSGFGACEGEIKPLTEDCTNDLDDDCSGLACAQGIWSHQFTVPGSVEGILFNQVAADDQGNVYLLGSFEGSIALGGSVTLTADGAGRRLYLARFLADGTPEWAKQYGDTGQTVGKNTLRVDRDGNAVLVGGIDNGSPDFGSGAGNPEGLFVAKVGQDGKTAWARFLAADALDITASAVVDPSTNDILLVGNFQGTATLDPGFVLTSPDSYDIYIARLSPSGTVQWVKQFGDASGQPPASQTAVAAGIDPSGNLFVVGRYTGTLDLGGPVPPAVGQGDLYLAKMTGSGGLVWARDMSTDATTFSSLEGFAVDAEGNAFLTGTFAGTIRLGDYPKSSDTPADYAKFLVKLGSDGKHKWSKLAKVAQPGFGSVILLRALGVDTAKNVILTGGFTDTLALGDFELASAGDLDVFVAKFANDGTGLWARSYGDAAAFQTAMSVALDPSSGSIVLTGVNDGVLNFGNGPISSDGPGLFIAKMAP